MIKLLKKIYFNPLRFLIFLLLKVLPNKLFYKRYFFNHKLNTKFFLISFDCDVQEDIICLPKLLEYLKKLNIKPTLAIPGQLIEKNIDMIKRLHEKYNIEFMNHGYFTHTEIYDDIYVSTKFYKDEVDSRIYEDIELGHQVLVKKLRYKPKGFRAPHFGELNQKLIKKIYKKIIKLGYHYSSSTIYDNILLKGPISHYENLIELSVSGCFNRLYKILDSWTFLKSTIKKPNEFKNELNKNKELFLSSPFINYMNLYVDPSHIVDKMFFFNFLKDLSKYSKHNLIEFVEEYKK